MQLHQVQRNTAHKTKKRVGRGGTRGKTSGRGHKGQKAHAGSSPRPQMRDIIKKLPKRRGYRFKTIKEKPTVVNLATLDQVFKNGDRVSPDILVTRGIISTKRKGRSVKVLGNGDTSKKLIFSGVQFSERAKQKIEKAGGTTQTHV